MPTGYLEMARGLRSLVFMLLVEAAARGTALAQSGGVVGKVILSQGGRPLAGAVITVLTPTGVEAAQASSRADGTFRILGLSAGTYLVRVASIGYAVREFAGVSVSARGMAAVRAVMEERPAQLEELSVTVVSKVPEPIPLAPATVFVITRTEIAERPALTVVDHLKTIPGVDLSTGGLVQSNVVTRGFNNIFSGALLTLIDSRRAAVPSLQVNVPTFLPVSNEDVERIELVLGPGAALYGPNSANGVLNIITRSSFTSTGTTLSLEGGARAGSSYLSGPGTRTDNGAGIWRVTGRHAMRLGSRVAFKLSGNFLQGTEWRFRDAEEPDNLDVLRPGLGIPPGRCNSSTGCRHFKLEQFGGEARVDVRPDANSEIVAAYGITDAKNLIEYTGLGAAQARGWKSSAAQVRYTYKRLFLQGFGTFSSSGGTFLLRDGHEIHDSSRVWSAQFHHGFDLGRRETVLYGADYSRTDPRTGGTINGRNEADDGIQEIGGYVHSVTRLGARLDLVGALRLDKNSRLERAVLSPRAGLVYRPRETQSFRLTFNRAYSTPSDIDLFLDLAGTRIGLDETHFFDVRGLGVPADGFQFRFHGGCAGGTGDGLCMQTPFHSSLPTGTPDFMPARAAILWRAAVSAVLPAIARQDPQLAALLNGIPDPTGGVDTQLRLLNPATGTFFDVAGEQVRDISRLKPTVSSQLEVGYKALIANRFQISVDAWYEHKRNFIGPLRVESPTVFLDRATTKAYLLPFLGNLGALQDTTAGTLAQLMAGLSNGSSNANATGVPLGTVVPNNTSLTARPDIFLTARNFGSVNLWGADLAADMVFGKHLSVEGSYSFVNKDFFPRSELKDAPADIALNASRSKGSLTVGWRDEPSGWSIESRLRALKGFPVSSGVYTSAPDPRDPGRLLPTDSYGVLDLQGTWRPRFGSRNLLFSANIQDLLNKHYATFVGIPRIGRVFLTKLTYTI
jgi:iron complex outermembrane receptor protein